MIFSYFLMVDAACEVKLEISCGAQVQFKTKDQNKCANSSTKTIGWQHVKISNN